MLRIPSLVIVTLAILAALRPTAQVTQQPSEVEISRLGPPVGAQAPPFSGVDQAGQSHSLESSLGPKGAMVVFFRSADW